MSKLYNSATKTFSALAKKHDNFMRPSYRITVGGKDMTNVLGFYADSVEITQTVGDKAGSLKFSIQNAYDIKSRRFQSGLKSSFPLGAEIECALGYKNPPTLFKGFIGDVSFSFSENAPPKATIACFDIRTLMKQGRMNAMMPVSSFPIVMLRLLAYYTSLVSMQINYIDLWNILEEFKQNTNDFNYIYGYAQKRGYEFFVLGEHIYFILKRRNTAPITTLEWGESILNFSRNYSYGNIKVKGVISDTLSMIPFLKDSEPKLSYPTLNATTAKIEHYPDASDAKNRLDLLSIMYNYEKKIETDMSGGTVKCIGLPEIIPGRFIALKNLDSDFLDKNYYIDSVTHSFSGSGYTTSFNISAEL
ncbi:MAG: hypothetical protein FWE74_08610 [Oscillospiraceae bacterium]|nr:hypothetical protein [Oscillospiraceae bacterium]